MSKLQMPDRVPLEISHATKMRSCTLRVDRNSVARARASGIALHSWNGRKSEGTLLALDEIGKSIPADGTTEAKLTLVMLRKRGGFSEEMYYLRRGQGRKIKRRSIHPIQKREII